MINGNLDQFLDNGWHNEAELYYKGYIYWCEGAIIPGTQNDNFMVDRWLARNENNLLYHSYVNKEGDFLIMKWYLRY